MNNYDNSNRGQFWGNDKKTKDTDPDFKGSVNVEGVEYWLSGWRRKEGANPKAPSVSFSIQKKDQAHVQGHAQVTQTVNGPVEAHVSPPSMDSFDDTGIPF